MTWLSMRAIDSTNPGFDPDSYTSILHEVDWKIKSCEWSVEFFIGYPPRVLRHPKQASGWPPDWVSGPVLGAALMISVSRCLAPSAPR